ncbi:hypothetical protein D3C72_1080460 [compost metagenome]
MGAQLIDGAGGGRRHLLALEGVRRGPGREAALGALHVRGVVAGVAVEHLVLAGVGLDDHHELMGRRAADRAHVALHGAGVEAAAAEDARVGLGHVLVLALEVVGVLVEGVGVLHDELAAAQQAEARANLVTHLGLNLVQVDRQLAVGAHRAAHDVGDDLLVRGAEHLVAVVAVLEAHQLFAVLLPAAGLHPQLGRDHDRHVQLLGAGGVHLLADDRLDLLDHPEHQGQQAVDAGAEAADVARAGEQLVRDDLGVGRDLSERGGQKLGHQHGIGAPSKGMQVFHDTKKNGTRA